MLTPEAVAAVFDAEVIQTVTPAADQDGHEGGYVASNRDHTLHGWAPTPEGAKRALTFKPVPTDQFYLEC